MPIEILMPALSPTMTEGNLTKWLKKEGDKIKPGEVIAEIETDKATMEVEAVDAGIIGKILVQAGSESVKVNSLIALILEDSEDHSSLVNYQVKGAIKIDIKEEVVVATKVDIVTRTDNERMFASPLARRIAKNENIDLTKINGTGPRGRIIKADLVNKPQQQIAAKTSDNKIPNSNMRKVIAKRLVESKQTIPHFYLNMECELDNLLKIRAEMNHEGATYKLSVNDFIIKAVAHALVEVPEANATWSEEAITLFANVDISVAVAIDGGLITPIVRNADQKTISQISNEMKDLANRAKLGKLAPAEFQGGGFSISNLGMFGVKNFNAIINPPQSCILAVGAGTERVVARAGKMEIRTIMDVTLSVDHRSVDGAVGARFLAAFKKLIENPILMFV